MSCRYIDIALLIHRRGRFTAQFKVPIRSICVVKSHCLPVAEHRALSVSRSGLKYLIQCLLRQLSQSQPAMKESN